MSDQPPNLISFAEFEIDAVHRRLFRNGEIVPLHAKAFDLLTFLARNQGKIVTKEEILFSVWNDKYVEESNLVVQISNLRKALRETKNSPRFLLTVPGKGYKFVGETNENLIIIETHSVSELSIEEIETPKFELSGSKKLNLKWIFTTGCLIITTLGIGYFWNNSQPKPNKPLRLTKLTNTGRIVNVTMSPDGTFAVFAQKENDGESLWLRQLETGSEKRIVEPQPLNYVGLTISPDNQFIYASKFLRNEVDPVLEKIPLLGGFAEKIPNIDCSSAISISPDGKRFAYTDSNSKDKETVFGIANIDGSNSQILKHATQETRSFPIFQANPLAWSPIGDEVAVAVSEKTENESFSTILLINPNDGSERYLTENRWRSINNLAWLDADRLVFIAKAEDGKPSQVWSISRKSGETKQLTNELKNYDWIAAAKNKILAIQINPISSLRIADFNENDFSLKINEINNASEYIDELDWTINGEIVFVSQASGKSELWQMQTDGTGSNQITSNANVTFGLGVSPIDGSITFSANQNGISGIWQVNLEGKNLRQISQGADKSPDISNDGKIVFHRGHSNVVQTFFHSNGETKLLKENCYFPAISPNGTKTACYFMDETEKKWKIAIIANDSGEILSQIQPPIPIYERQIRWHPSGKFITQIFSEGEKLKLLLLPIEKGEPKIIDGLGKGESNLPEWSPDGKRFLYPQITTTQDVVMLSDF